MDCGGQEAAALAVAILRMTARKRPLSYRLARCIGGSRTHTLNALIAAATAALGAASVALPALQDQLGPWPFAALSVLAAAGNGFLRALPRTDSQEAAE